MFSESKLIWVLQSRKFWASVIGFVSILWVAYQSGSALDPDTVVNAILGIVAAYMAATAWEDGKNAEAAGRVSAADIAGKQTTVSTPGESDVTVTASNDKPPPFVGRTGLQ